MPDGLGTLTMTGQTRMGTMLTLTIIGSCGLAIVAKVVEIRIKRRIGLRLTDDA